MAINLKSTGGIHTAGIKVCVFGQSGAGKTSLIKTCPAPLVLSAEAGLLALSGSDIPYIEIDSMEALSDAYRWIGESDDAKDFQTICLDSISEIAEVCLSAEKKKAADPRQAYGHMQEQISGIIRAFRDMAGRNVYFSAKVEKSQDETGRVLWAPAMPGKKMAQNLPYFFDEVLALRVERDTDDNVHRALLCHPDGTWLVKDRSGKLEPYESPDLGKLFKKIAGDDHG